MNFPPSLYPFHLSLFPFLLLSSLLSTLLLKSYYVPGTLQCIPRWIRQASPCHCRPHSGGRRQTCEQRPDVVRPVLYQKHKVAPGTQSKHTWPRMEWSKRLLEEEAFRLRHNGGTGIRGWEIHRKSSPEDETTMGKGLRQEDSFQLRTNLAITFLSD